MNISGNTSRHLYNKWNLLICLLCLPFAANALETHHNLTMEQWAVPRTAEVVIAMPALSRAMQELQATPDSRLLIRYPGGDEGSMWVKELTSWLVSLGISSADLELTPGSTNHQVIQLEVVTDSLRPMESMPESVSTNKKYNPEMSEVNP